MALSRDSMNPLLNVETLRNRLAVIEHYKNIRGEKLGHQWTHHAMNNALRHLNRYKFNYGIKAFAAYVVYRDFAHMKHLKQRMFITNQQEAQFLLNISTHTAMFGALCAFI